MDLPVVKFGSLIDEFLEVADSAFAGDGTFRTPRGTIDTRKALENCEERYNNMLINNKWVRARAKENLRLNRNPVTKQSVNAEVRRIVADYQAETESHRAMTRGLKTWISIIPIVGPSYAIADGIRHHDAWEVVTGVIFLGLDALDLLGGESPRAKTPAKGARALAPREHIAVSSVDHAMHKLDLPRGRFSEHLKTANINPDPLGIAVPDAKVPVAFRDLATRVRNGEHGVTWENHELIYLRNENRVVPVKNRGGAYQELDWYTSERVPGSRLIYRSGDGYYSNLALKGGGSSPNREVMGTKLSERYTVKEVVDIMQRARDGTDRAFRQLFDSHFKISADEGASTFEPVQFYQSLYAESSTFRRLFNHATDQATELGESAWEIVIKPRQRPATHFGQHRIQLPSDAELLTKRYVGPDGFKSVQLQQAYLHEMVHALTLKQDPLSTAALRHRGPIVYLTDKILNEAGFDFPQQVIYRRPSDTNASPTELDNDLGQRHRLLALEAMVVENHYLDAILDKGGLINGETLALGQPLETRLTVESIQTFLSETNKIPLLAIDEAIYFYNFGDVFHMGSSAGGLKMVQREELRVFYGKLFSRSATFRLLVRKWMTERIQTGDKQPWKFCLGGSASVTDPKVAPRMHVINDAAHAIHIQVDGSLYLSADGLRTVEFDRRLTQAMVDLVSGHDDPSVLSGHHNRGRVVYLTDQILHEAGFSHPRQIADKLAAPGDEAAKNRLLQDQTNVRRAADMEDRYLKKAVEQHCALFGTCMDPIASS
jgi:hypothetical protein